MGPCRNMNTVTKLGCVLPLLLLNSSIHICAVSNNKAYNGGAVYAKGISSSTVKVYAENSILQGNFASNNGGGMSISHATVTLTSTTLASNSARVGGGWGLCLYSIQLLH